MHRKATACRTAATSESHCTPEKPEPLHVEEQLHIEDPLHAEEPLRTEEPQQAKELLHKEVPLHTEEPLHAEEPLRTEKPRVAAGSVHAKICSNSMRCTAYISKWSDIVLEHVSVVCAESKALHNLPSKQKGHVRIEAHIERACNDVQKHTEALTNLPVFNAHKKT